MTGRLLLSAALALLCWTRPASADPGPGLTPYRVQLVLYPGDDAAAVAKRLAAIYRGTLETPVDAEGGFVIALSPAGADLMERDPAVGRLAVAETSAASALVPETTGMATPRRLGNYEYDGSGNIRRIGSDFFVYDTRNRLVVSADASAIPLEHKQAYTYDNFGNLTAITTAGAGQTTLSVDTSSNRVTTVGGGLAPATLAYDAVGNLTRYGTATYTADALNMLTRSNIDGVTRHYVYSANDERIGMVEVSSAGTRSDWTIRDPGGQVLRRFSRETNGEWKWQEDYIYRGTQMLAAEVPDAGKTLHFHLDHLGTPRLITGNGGVELSRHDYHPFGVEIAPTSTSTTAIMREKKQFTGHERDAESLDYMHARFYAPYMGRFLSVDPVLDLKRTLPEPQRWNRYSYVVNNPLNRIDPDGRMDGNGLGEPVAWRCPGCTRAEAIEQSNQIAKGTAMGAAASLAIMAGPSGWRALGAAAMNWVRGNPGAAQNLANAVLSPHGSSALPSVTNAVSGEILHEVSTSKGAIGIMANATTNGTTLTLTDAAIYPMAAGSLTNKIGPKEMLSALKQMGAQLKEQGYMTLIIQGKRATGANPGKASEIVLDLSKL